MAEKPKCEGTFQGECALHPVFRKELGRGCAPTHWDRRSQFFSLLDFLNIRNVLLTVPAPSDGNCPQNQKDPAAVE